MWIPANRVGFWGVMWISANGVGVMWIPTNGVGVWRIMWISANGVEVWEACGYLPMGWGSGSHVDTHQRGEGLGVMWISANGVGV